MKTNIILGQFKDTKLVIHLTPKRDVMLATIIPGVRPIPLWRRVPADKSPREIIEHLLKRDGDRFKKSGGVTWYF